MDVLLGKRQPCRRDMFGNLKAVPKAMRAIVGYRCVDSVSLSTVSKAWFVSKGYVLILGARSDVAMAVAHRFAKAG